MYKKVYLQEKERWQNSVTVSKNALEKAAEKALRHLEINIDRFGDKMVEPVGGWFRKKETGFSRHYYDATDQVTWSSSLWTGSYWLAYQLTDDEKFRKTAESHLKYYLDTVNYPEKLNNHDTGFKYTPSCVAAYKITGNEEARKAALRAAEIQLEHVCPVNKFLIRVGTRSANDKYVQYRTLVDSMMNIPLFFWAYEETGEKAYYDAAVGHYHTTTNYLVREDGSSYHHYQFDPITMEPVCGVTHQGNSNESCWSRGHAWLVYGYPLAYKYTRDAEIFDIHEAVSYFFMNHLPKDCVPYWDFDFTDGSFEPRDSSASAIAACGLLEMCKYLPEEAENKRLFKNAAEKMIQALIERCANENEETDCLLTHVTGSKPHSLYVDNCATYGDYFYFEALCRLLKPEFPIIW